MRCCFGFYRKQIIQFIIGVIVFIAALLLKDNNIQPYLFFASYIILGFRVIFKAIRNLFRGEVFDENFLMSFATGVAFAIGEFPEAVAVMLFYLVGEFFQDTAVDKSKKSISNLMDIRPDYANIKTSDGLKRVSPENVGIGDIIVVKAGEKIPLDGVVIDGESTLDTKALTGESIPRSVKISDDVLSACINLNGVLTVKVTKTFGESTVAKILDLLENANNKKSPTEHFITTFSKYYTPSVIFLAVLLATLPPLFFGGIWSDWIYRALVFLVVSCPCALVISIPLGFFAGIGCASKNGVLVKGGNYLEALNKLDIVVFDKTGTLTKGVFKVTNIYNANDFTKESLMEYAANAEQLSNHPIAFSILKHHGKNIAKESVSNYKEIAGYGISAAVNGVNILVGNSKLMEMENISFNEINEIGTKVYVSVNKNYAGCIVISDEIKSDSSNTIKSLKAQGIKTVMLTGDSEDIAQEVAKELSIDEVYAQLLPNQKVEKIEEFGKQKSAKGKLAFVGDGINDAPVLAMADVGIAMGAFGSDAAIEAADVVLMTDEPSKLLNAIKIAKSTRRIVMQNIIFALGIKGAFLILGAFGISGMWEAVFADIGVAMLAILNATRVMRR